MFSDAITALIRTAVPAIVGTIIAFLIDRGVSIGDDTVTALNAALVPVCISVYYALVTYLEREVNPSFGWLLGQAKTPTYAEDEGAPVDHDSNETIGDTEVNDKDVSPSE